MSHHSSEPNRDMHEAMKRMFGEHPAGKLNNDDAGAIACQIGTESNRVVMRFPKPVAWIGFTGDEAMQLAQTLMKHARTAGITAPFVLRVGE